MEERLLIEIGQHIATGFPGKEMPAGFVEAVKKFKIGNIILFSRNIESLEQLNALCVEIDSLVASETGRRPFIMIDQEGGMVSRLPEDAPVVPGQMALASLGSEETIENCAYLNGRLLMDVGCNFNLAPTVDVNENPANPVIGVRSFGDSFERVARCSALAVEGYARSGILSCAKHFPGHGNTFLDSHLALPSVDRTLDEMEGQLLPFRKAIEAGVPAVMTSHILFPKIEKEAVPCTMSPLMLRGLLRERMKFDGLIITDCMAMQAIAKYYGTVNGAVRALAAGADIVLVSHHADLAAQAMMEMARGLESGLLDRSALDRGLGRIERLKRSLPAPKRIGDMGRFEKTRKRFDETARRCVATLKEGRPSDLSRLVFIAPQAYITSNISDQIDRKGFAPWMRERFPGSEAVVVSADPDGEEIERIVSNLAPGSVAVVGTYNAHLQKGQLRLVARLREKGFEIHLFVLRNPYDAGPDLLRSVDSCVLTFEYSTRMFQRCRELLLGEAVSVGRPPINLEV